VDEYGYEITFVMLCKAELLLYAPKADACFTIRVLKPDKLKEFQHYKPHSTHLVILMLFLSHKSIPICKFVCLDHMKSQLF
jgi:hypothetical protein